MNLSLGQTLPLLMLASTPGMCVYGLAGLWDGAGSSAVYVAAVVGLVSFAAGLLFVFPVLAFVPRLRTPPRLVAAAWGALVAWLAIAVLLMLVTSANESAPGLSLAEVLRWSGILVFGGMGAAAGLVYSIAARRVGRHVEVH